MLGAWDCHWRWPTVRAVPRCCCPCAVPWSLGLALADCARAVPPRLLLAGLLGAWEEEDAVGRAGS